MRFNMSQDTSRSQFHFFIANITPKIPQLRTSFLELLPAFPRLANINFTPTSTIVELKTQQKPTAMSLIHVIHQLVRIKMHCRMTTFIIRMHREIAIALNISRLQPCIIQRLPIRDRLSLYHRSFFRSSKILSVSNCLKPFKSFLSTHSRNFTPRLCHLLFDFFLLF